MSSRIPCLASTSASEAKSIHSAQCVRLLEGGSAATFSASVGSIDVTAQFVAADGVSAPSLPQVPSGASRWIFTASQGGTFDRSAFDRSQTFDAAAFSVRMQWLRLQPLVFDVVLPYFVDAAVQRLLAGSGFENRFKLFKGLSLNAIQRVVDGRRAAGVRGMVQYAITLPGESTARTPWDDQGADDRFTATLDASIAENHAMAESLAVGAFDSETELHETSEHFAIGGIFNVAVFDGSFGFH